MSAMAASIVAGLRGADPDRSIEVDIKEGITGFADRGLIEIVLTNLIGNAWKFTGKTEHADPMINVCEYWIWISELDGRQGDPDGDTASILKQR